MKSEVTKRTDTTATLAISVDEAAFAPIVTQTIERLRAKVKVAGFRPGKAPDNIVVRELGENAVQGEVLEAAITQSYARGVSEQALAVMAPPEVQVDKFIPYTQLEYTATVDIMPKISLADYKHFKMKRPEVKVETAEIEQTLTDLRKRLATRRTVDRPAKMGDEVTIDFVGTKDGQTFEGGSSQNHVLELGSKSFIPGFEELLVGVKPGDDKTFDINFPDDYHQKDLAGQKVTFAVKVHKVEDSLLPDADEALAATVGPFKSLAELKSDIEGRIKAEKAEAVEKEFEDNVLQELVAKSKLSLPKRLVEQQLSRMKEELTQRLAQNGLDLEKYLGLVSKTTDEMDKEMLPEAEKRVALALILNEIARTEDIKVSSKEIEDEVQHLKDTYKDPVVQAELADPSILEDVHNHLLASRTIAKILSYIPV